MLIHDLIGIGFGPSNIALAIALHEQQAGAAGRVNPLFIERQPRFAWHQGMLLRDAHMQISFLKDLATLRNPTSRFTFISYLYEKQRLQDFINLKTFFPSRHEFNDYFCWAAAQFENWCAYGEEVIEILPEHRGSEIALLRVRSRGADGQAHERLARNLVVSIGGTPRMPDCLQALADDPRVFHSHHYLPGVAANAQAKSVAVVGAGQSAAETFLDLLGQPNAPKVDLVMRARAIKPSDDSPFVNEIFNVDFVDEIFSRSEAERREFLREFRHTNYACPDLALIEQIFKVLYEQRVKDEIRHRFLRRHEIRQARSSPEGIHLTLHDLNSGRTDTVRYDAVVVATGYQRQQHKALLARLAPHLGEFEIDRQYRVKSHAGFLPAIYVQGASEGSHGLSDTLLSVTAARSGEICDALLQGLRSPARIPVDAAL